MTKFRLNEWWEFDRFTYYKVFLLSPYTIIHIYRIDRDGAITFSNGVEDVWHVASLQEEKALLKSYKGREELHNVSVLPISEKKVLSLLTMKELVQ